jgi:flagellar motor protein MotB
MEGQIIQQRRSYRQGLVLGLTMAEIMILLVFCLLIAMATFLKREETMRVAIEQQLQEQKLQNKRDREVVAALREDAALVEKLRSTSGLSDPQAIDQYWRELVDGRTLVGEIERSGLSLKQLREGLSSVTSLRANGIDLDKAIRDSQTLEAIYRAMAKPGEARVSTQAILDAIERGKTGTGTGGHQWPPIITMSEAGGYYFESGSAELSPSFRVTLLSETPLKILDYIRKYDVDVIEVVGHTDERPIGVRPSSSNLDRDLTAVLKNNAAVASLVPADNAGLGLARAVSVVSVLRQSPLLAPYKLVPLSGAQLVNTDETLALEGSPGDIQERRRIEIRLRKSVPHEATAGLGTAVGTGLGTGPGPAIGTGVGSAGIGPAPIMTPAPTRRSGPPLPWSPEARPATRPAY